MTKLRAQALAQLKHNPASPIGKPNPLSSERAREMSLMRRTFAAGPGAPRSKTKPRCACGLMTLKRALARGHECETEEPRSHKKQDKEGI